MIDDGLVRATQNAGLTGVGFFLEFKVGWLALDAFCDGVLLFL